MTTAAGHRPNAARAPAPGVRCTLLTPLLGGRQVPYGERHHRCGGAIRTVLLPVPCESNTSISPATAGIRTSPPRAIANTSPAVLRRPRSGPSPPEKSVPRASHDRCSSWPGAAGARSMATAGGAARGRRRRRSLRRDGAFRLPTFRGERRAATVAPHPAARRTRTDAPRRARRPLVARRTRPRTMERRWRRVPAHRVRPAARGEQRTSRPTRTPG